MTYIPQMGDIGLVAIGGSVGRAIRVGQWMLAKVDDRRAPTDEDWANYQHAFVYLGGGRLIEAEPGGARITDLSEYKPDEIYWCQNIGALLTDAMRAKVPALAEQLEGTPYSYVDYLALTAHKLHIWLPGLRAYIRATRHLICSQLADWMYDLLGAHLFKGVWDGDVDPLDLYLLDKALAPKTG